MKRVRVDQDIAPVSGVYDGLPDLWEIEVGLPGNPDQLIKEIADTEIIIVTSRVPVTEEVIANAPELELIGKLGTGIDNVDIAAADATGIPVTYTPGYNALSVAELALGLVLGAARRFTESRQLIEAGGWRDELTLGTRVTGSTVGIVGLGDVGKRFANLLRGFNVDILFSDPYVPPIDGELVAAEPTGLDELLERSDFVCVMPELTEETRGMIGAQEFDVMRDSAIVVNTSRGPVVDHDALVAALEAGEIAGAGLDVFAMEPLTPDSRLLDFENVVVSPHSGAMTDADRAKTITHLTRNLRALVDGQPIDQTFLATPSGG